MITQEDLSPVGTQLFNLIEFDEDEELVWEIRKHPLGLFVVYFVGFFVAVAVLAATVFINYLLRSDALGPEVNLGSFGLLILTVGLIIAVLSVLLTLISGYIYRRNAVLVTSEKIAQVLYKNIISRKISQLSIGDIQDVTVRQNGIFARFFNFGTLVIETAGEQQNYSFNYTPDPYKAAKEIVGAHERNLKKYGN